MILLNPVVTIHVSATEMMFHVVVDLIADMYENAHKVKPDNEEILSALFMAHVRLGDYKKQQQTAMILHRLRPNKNPYYFWAVMSIVMQVLNIILSTFSCSNCCHKMHRW